MVAPDPVVQQTIRDAMERLLAGQPRVVTSGRRSVVELAEEAGVSRPRLYREYADLKDEFLRRVEEADAAPPPATPRERELTEAVARLSDEVSELRARIAQLTSDKGSWKRASETFIRVINLLEREKQQLEVKIESDARAKTRLERRVTELRQALSNSDAVTPLRPSLSVVARTPEDPVDVLGETPTSRDHGQQTGPVEGQE